MGLLALRRWHLYRRDMGRRDRRDAAPHQPRRLMVPPRPPGHGRPMVPALAGGNNADDVVGSDEQYARTHHDAVYRPGGLALRVQRAEPGPVACGSLWGGFWSQPLRSVFGERPSGAIPVGHAMARAHQ